MQQHGSKFFYSENPLQPHPHDPDVGIKRSNSTFSEHGHIAYQIKENHE